MFVVIRDIFTIIITVAKLVAIFTCSPPNCSHVIGCSCVPWAALSLASHCMCDTLDIIVISIVEVEAQVSETLLPSAFNKPSYSAIRSPTVVMFVVVRSILTIIIAVVNLFALATRSPQ